MVNDTVVDRLRSLSLTPLQDALIDLLIARYRLGETRWTVRSDRHTRAALDYLTEVGGLTYGSHNASVRHVYASLTEEGRAAWINSETSYKAPVVREMEAVQEQNRILREMLIAAGLDPVFIPTLR